jgi:hypothetical protein
MHEEYLPGYDWEELLEQDIEKGTPLDDEDKLNKTRTPPRKPRKKPDKE